MRTVAHDRRPRGAPWPRGWSSGSLYGELTLDGKSRRLRLLGAKGHPDVRVGGALPRQVAVFGLVPEQDFRGLVVEDHLAAVGADGEYGVTTFGRTRLLDRCD